MTPRHSSHIFTLPHLFQVVRSPVTVQKGPTSAFDFTSFLPALLGEPTSTAGAVGEADAAAESSLGVTGGRARNEDEVRRLDLGD